ncbi:CCR4-NOT transcription complex subunit 1 [Babesia caballi]|uniref:CCR4-NOT transcription complex subunit 1 n=1 Tax=Babesia caballi TaxID=5871 RepID=A0AAV4LTI7_BABCB|nr:CCR4-NOT transcription complex subunit 1 [Babesia caballi]
MTHGAQKGPASQTGQQRPEARTPGVAVAKERLRAVCPASRQAAVYRMLEEAPEKTASKEFVHSLDGIYNELSQAAAGSTDAATSGDIADALLSAMVPLGGDANGIATLVHVAAYTSHQVLRACAEQSVFHWVFDLEGDVKQLAKAGCTRLLAMVLISTNNLLYNYKGPDFDARIDAGATVAIELLGREEETPTSGKKDKNDVFNNITNLKLETRSMKKLVNKTQWDALCTELRLYTPHPPPKQLPKFVVSLRRTCEYVAFHTDMDTQADYVNVITGSFVNTRFQVDLLLHFVEFIAPQYPVQTTDTRRRRDFEKLFPASQHASLASVMWVVDTSVLCVLLALLYNKQQVAQFKTLIQQLVKEGSHDANEHLVAKAVIYALTDVWIKDHDLLRNREGVVKYRLATVNPLFWFCYELCLQQFISSEDLIKEIRHLGGESINGKACSRLFDFMSDMAKSLPGEYLILAILEVMRYVHYNLQVTSFMVNLFQGELMDVFKSTRVNFSKGVLEVVCYCRQTFDWGFMTMLIYSVDAIMSTGAEYMSDCDSRNEAAKSVLAGGFMDYLRWKIQQMRDLAPQGEVSQKIFVPSCNVVAEIFCILNHTIGTCDELLDLFQTYDAEYTALHHYNVLMMPLYRALEARSNPDACQLSGVAKAVPNRTPLVASVDLRDKLAGATGADKDIYSYLVLNEDIETTTSHVVDVILSCKLHQSILNAAALLNADVESLRSQTILDVLLHKYINRVVMVLDLSVPPDFCLHSVTAFDEEGMGVAPRLTMLAKFTGSLLALHLTATQCDSVYIIFRVIIEALRRNKVFLIEFAIEAFSAMGNVLFYPVFTRMVINDERFGKLYPQFVAQHAGGGDRAGGHPVPQERHRRQRARHHGAHDTEAEHRGGARLRGGPGRVEQRAEQREHGLLDREPRGERAVQAADDWHPVVPGADIDEPQHRVPRRPAGDAQNRLPGTAQRTRDHVHHGDVAQQQELHHARGAARNQGARRLAAVRHLPVRADPGVHALPGLHRLLGDARRHADDGRHGEVHGVLPQRLPQVHALVPGQRHLSQTPERQQRVAGGHHPGAQQAAAHQAPGHQVPDSVRVRERAADGSHPSRLQAADERQELQDIQAAKPLDELAAQPAGGHQHVERAEVDAAVRLVPAFQEPRLRAGAAVGPHAGAGGAGFGPGSQPEARQQHMVVVCDQRHQVGRAHVAAGVPSVAGDAGAARAAEAENRAEPQGVEPQLQVAVVLGARQEDHDDVRDDDAEPDHNGLCVAQARPHGHQPGDAEGERHRHGDRAGNQPDHGDGAGAAVQRDGVATAHADSVCAVHGAVPGRHGADQQPGAGERVPRQGQPGAGVRAGRAGDAGVDHGVHFGVHRGVDRGHREGEPECAALCEPGRQGQREPGHLQEVRQLCALRHDPATEGEAAGVAAAGAPHEHEQRGTGFQPGAGQSRRPGRSRVHAGGEVAGQGAGVQAARLYDNSAHRQLADVADLVQGGGVLAAGDAERGLPAGGGNCHQPHSDARGGEAVPVREAPAAQGADRGPVHEQCDGRGDAVPEFAQAHTGRPVACRERLADEHKQAGDVGSFGRGADTPVGWARHGGLRGAAPATGGANSLHAPGGYGDQEPHGAQAGGQGEVKGAGAALGSTGAGADCAAADFGARHVGGLPGVDLLRRLGADGVGAVAQRNLHAAQDVARHPGDAAARSRAGLLREDFGHAARRDGAPRVGAGVAGVPFDALRPRGAAGVRDPLDQPHVAQVARAAYHTEPQRLAHVPPPAGGRADVAARQDALREHAAGDLLAEGARVPLRLLPEPLRRGAAARHAAAQPAHVRRAAELQAAQPHHPGRPRRDPLAELHQPHRHGPQGRRPEGRHGHVHPRPQRSAGAGGDEGAPGDRPGHVRRGAGEPLRALPHRHAPRHPQEDTHEQPPGVQQPAAAREGGAELHLAGAPHAPQLHDEPPALPERHHLLLRLLHSPPLQQRGPADAGANHPRPPGAPAHHQAAPVGRAAPALPAGQEPQVRLLEPDGVGAGGGEAHPPDHTGVRDHTQARAARYPGRHERTCQLATRRVLRLAVASPAGAGGAGRSGRGGRTAGVRGFELRTGRGRRCFGRKVCHVGRSDGTAARPEAGQADSADLPPRAADSAPGALCGARAATASVAAPVRAQGPAYNRPGLGVRATGDADGPRRGAADRGGARGPGPAGQSVGRGVVL